MKHYFLAATAAAALAGLPSSVLAEAIPPSFVYESPREFFGSGDFDGDQKIDLIIVDKDTGKYRLGYQTASGMLNWIDCRPSTLKGLTGFSMGKVLPSKLDAFVFTSPDANQISLVDAVSASTPPKPTVIGFDAALGPSMVVAVDIGGEGNSPSLDLAVASIYNSPDPNLSTLLRNDGKEFPKLFEAVLQGTAVRGNRLALKSGGPEFLCYLLNGDTGDTFQVEDLRGGKPAVVGSVTGLPAGSDYAVGNFRGVPAREVLFYKPGQSTLLLRTVDDAGGQAKFGPEVKFDLGQPIKRVVTLAHGAGQRLLVITGEGEQAMVFNFDGSKAPTAVHTIYATNDQFTCAASLPNGFILLAQPAGGKFSTRYNLWHTSGEAYAQGPFGGLPSLADNDNIIIPDIHARILQKTKEIPESEMTLYTNTIPGTRVSYAMVPIKGGEFIMGSPESEADRKPDEGPQHKVKISPFWMGRCEITWNEYELFMYPDEEKRTRATIPTDEAGDKLADAVTHPSKPYVEMSFGMGKEGFPAISMTQHGANKYCQWLSAKTGEFYRLPTEAEWEYAARAGTSTAYFFGDDPSKAGEYGWYEQNSDFKYQKVGKKKPNPWGLHDISGNVVEWVLDQYDAEWYTKCNAGSQVVDPWNRATKPYPHSVRGGSWDDEVKMLRSAARRGSDRAWKMQDPQLPKSVWYFSDAQFVGFRVVRPLKVPDSAAMQKYWTSGVERD